MAVSSLILVRAEMLSLPPRYGVEGFFIDYFNLFARGTKQKSPLVAISLKKNRYRSRWKSLRRNYFSSATQPFTTSKPPRQKSSLS
jgi:hypothetical protein